MPSYAVPTQAQYDAINAAAQKNGVSTALELALANQESGFSQSAVSPQGAVGIFQLMPGAASDVGLAPGAQYNEQANIMGGSAYLRKMLDAFGGNEATALTAYNAGIGNVKTLGATAASQLPNADPNYARNIQVAEAHYAAAYNLTPQANYSGTQTSSGNPLANYGKALIGGASTVAGVLNPLTTTQTIVGLSQSATNTPGGIWTGPFGLSLNVGAFNKNLLTIAIILILIAGGVFLMAPKQIIEAAAA